MGPSGSGKSTLMHALAGLDTLTSGAVFIGDTDLSTLNDKQLTQLRRDRIGFIFQAFNLVPTLTALENITLPMTLAGRKPDPDWLDSWSTPSVSDAGSSTVRRSSPAASSSASPSPGPWPAGRRSSSPTSRPATSTPAPAPRSSRSCAPRCASSARRIVMVTHDPVAASYADRAVFLADGRIVDEIADPTADRSSTASRASALGRRANHATNPTTENTMFRLTIKELLAKKLRLLTTALAVLLGVAFIAGTLVLTDTMNRTFDNVLSDANAGTDAYVRGVSELDAGTSRRHASTRPSSTPSPTPPVVGARPGS